MSGTRHDKDVEKGCVENSGGPAAGAEIVGISYFMLTELLLCAGFTLQILNVRVHFIRRTAA